MSSFKLQTMHKFQKPLLFGLAVFLMVAFGVPWSQFSNQDRRASGVYDVINGHKVTRAEFNQFYTRWIEANPSVARNYSDNLESYIKEQFILIEEAKKAGLSVSDAEVAQAVKQRLPRLIRVDKVVASPEDFKKEATVTDEEIQTYYNDHKDSFTVADSEETKPLDEVRGEISSKLQDQKAQELAQEALENFKTKLQEAKYQVDRAFQEAAITAGAQYDSVTVYDEDNVLQNRLGELADNEDLTKQIITGPLGKLLGPFDTEDGKTYLRVSLRTAGFDKDGQYHNKTYAWTVDGWGVSQEHSYAELAAAQYRGISPEDLEQTVREQLLIQRYQQLLANASGVTADTLEQYYYRTNEKARADYLSFNLYDFRPAVEVNDQELEDFYNKYKSNPPTQNGAPGYQEPEKVKIEYVLAKKPAAREANYTDDQLRKYYNEHKDQYDQNFEDVKETVKNDLINDEFENKVKQISLAASAVEQAFSNYVAAKVDPNAELEASLPTHDALKQAAKKYGLTYKETDYIRKDGRNLYGEVDGDIAADRKKLLDAAFTDTLMTTTDLETLSPRNRDAARRRVISTIVDTRTGSKYFFRVLDRKPAQQVPFAEIDRSTYNRVKYDLTMQKARQLAKDQAAKVAVQIRKDAFDAIAQAVGAEPEVKPADPTDQSPIAKAATKLQAGEMSGIIEDGDKLAIVFCEEGKENVFNWHILSFGKEQGIPPLPLKDDELADYLDKNIETFAEYLPLSGTAAVQYIAAKYDDLADDVELTDAEVEQYYEDNKAEFEGKTLEEARPAVEEAARLAQAKEKADELIARAYETAKADDSKFFSQIVKDTPLVSKYEPGIKLDNVEETEFLGKAQDLGRTILSTKTDELVAPIKTDAGVFFFKIYSKNIGKGTELIEELPDEGKQAVRDALAKAQAAGTPTERATVQAARYVQQAFAAAPKNHRVVLESKLNLQVTPDRQLSLSAPDQWTPETVEQLLASKPDTLVGPVTDGNRVALFNVKEIGNLQNMKVEYIALDWQNFVQPKSNDYQSGIEEGTEKAKAAAEKIKIAAKEGVSLSDALKSVEGDIDTQRNLTAITTPWITVGSPNTMLPPDYLAKIAALEPGQVSDVQQVRNTFFIARLLETKPAQEVKLSFVRVGQKDFLTGDTNAQDALKKAEDALKAFRAEAVKQGSLEAALPTLENQIPTDTKPKVEGGDEYINPASPPPSLLGKRNLVAAIEAAKPGEITDVVKDGASFYVASVKEVRQPKSVTVDWGTLYNYSCSDPLRIPDEKVKAYFEEHKEDYRRERQLQISCLSTNDGDFKDEAAELATDDALKAYFEANKAKYAPQGGADQEAAVAFEDVKEAVKRDFVNEKSGELANQALADARNALKETEEAELEAVATEVGAEYRPLGYQTKERFGYRTEFRPITGLSDVIFKLNEGDVSQIQSKGADHYLFKITDVKEAYIPEYADVKDEVRPDVDKEIQPERAKKAAAEIKTKIEQAMADGKSFVLAASEATVDFAKHKEAVFKTTDSLFSRTGKPEGISGDAEQFVETTFSLRLGQVSKPVAEEFERYAVRLLTLRDFEEPEAPTESDLDSMKYSLSYQLRRQMLDETLANVRYQAQMPR